MGLVVHDNSSDLNLLFCVERECAGRFLRELIDVYKTALYAYNTAIKSYDVYLKPVHIVVKKRGDAVVVYHYYGKYWYRIRYEKGKLKWIYLGRERPLPDLPNPPVNPLTVVKIVKRDGNGVCVYIDSISSLKAVDKYIDAAVKRSGCINLTR